jgi:replication factor C large subunit
VTQNQPWTHQYRPSKREDFVGNREAVSEIEKWLKKWRKKPPKKKALFLYGPPGIGKTSIAEVIAREYGFELIEVNASDKRNKGTLEEDLGKTCKQNVTLFGNKRLILVDEMDGLSGSQDRGGISAISKIIEESTSPMILVANTIEENMESRFRTILKKSKSVEFKPLKHRDVMERLHRIAEDQDIDVSQEVLQEIALKSEGDLRSAINDLEMVCRGKEIIRLDDIHVLKKRDKLDYTPNILNKIFTSDGLWEARQTVNQSMISYDDLYDWIYENLPIVLDDPNERLEALDKLSKADIYQNRARAGDWRLLKYFFDLMTGGIAFCRHRSKGEGYKEQLNQAIQSVGLEPHAISTNELPEGIQIKPNRWLGKEKWSQLNKNLRGIGANWVYGKNVWVLPYYREPQTKWRYIFTYHKRRRLDSVARNLARKCHTSTDEVKKDILPLIQIMIRNDKEIYNVLSNWLLDIQTNKLDYLRFMSFDKSPRDYVNLESYSKFKQREIEKMMEQATEQRETDISNIEKWLQEEKKQATWN